jgi:hypothetical protein
VKEESQIEEMRTALRGDRERADARRRSSEHVVALTEPTPAASHDESEPEPRRRRSLVDRLLGR